MRRRSERAHGETSRRRTHGLLRFFFICMQERFNATILERVSHTSQHTHNEQAVGWGTTEALVHGAGCCVLRRGTGARGESSQSRCYQLHQLPDIKREQRERNCLFGSHVGSCGVSFSLFLFLYSTSLRTHAQHRVAVRSTRRQKRR